MRKLFHTDWPVISYTGEKNESSEHILLVKDDSELKTTAQDEGEYWIIRHWELNIDRDGDSYWFESSCFSIYKSTVEALFIAQSKDEEFSWVNTKKVENEQFLREIKRKSSEIIKEIFAQRDGILKAFIAETGLLPSECEQVEQGGKWWVRKREL